jgi:peptide/nickel transport system permease protein
LPGQDPADVIAGQGATEEQKQRIREDLGLERPVVEQYWDWLSGVLVGDFGESYESQASVREQFFDKFPLSFELVAISVIFSAVFGVAAGIISAVYRNGWLDYNVRLLAVAGASVPSFFLLTLLVTVPFNLWNYAPPTGGDIGFFDNPARNLELILPTAILLGIASSAGMLRLVRTTMLEVLQADYIRTARAKGLPRPSVIVGHALRNSSTPILTALGAEFIAVFGGSIIAEQVLSIRGVGEWFFSAAFKRDLPVVQFLVVYTAFIVIIVNLIVDLSYAWADPRVRYS